MSTSETGYVHPLRAQHNPDDAATAGIFPAVAYRYLDQDELRYPGFYSSYNQLRLGSIMASLEKGSWGMCFSSGMAAITTAILSLTAAGDHIIFLRELYGGTLRFATDELPKRGITCSFATTDVNNISSLVTRHTRIIYIESPSNPLLNIVSLKEVVELARKHHLITIIDNTFASPVNQLPLEAGIDISIESGTKYLGGHNDLPFGTLASTDDSLKPKILSTARIYGGSLTPHECYLAERSIKTLFLRVQKQNQNALKIAGFLENHNAIDNVYYPGLENHPQHSLAASQMSGFGGMISFELKTNAEGIRKFHQELKIVTPAISLGGVESLLSSPMLTSHRYLTEENRLGLGIKNNLLRLSCGIEDADDLIEDISNAIDKVI